MKINVNSLVVGDVIHCHEGMQVPADAVIVDSAINEACDEACEEHIQ